MIKKLTIGCVCAFLAVNSAFASDKATLVENPTYTGTILETKNAGTYLYIKVKSENETFWAAVPSTKIKVGETVTLKESTWMKDFKSKTLDQKFDKIMFGEIKGAKKAIHGVDNVHGIHGQMMKKKQEEKPNPKFDDITVSKEAAIKTTISDLYDNKAKYKNKNVEVQGDVIQVSNKVMGNTWIKIYDGKDAVIFRSTNEDEQLKIGDIVKVTGMLNTDVDYGYGFKYEIIGVNAKFTKIN